MLSAAGRSAVPLHLLHFASAVTGRRWTLLCMHMGNSHASSLSYAAAGHAMACMQQACANCAGVCEGESRRPAAVTRHPFLGGVLWSVEASETTSEVYQQSIRAQQDTQPGCCGNVNCGVKAVISRRAGPAPVCPRRPLSFRSLHVGWPDGSLCPRLLHQLGAAPAAHAGRQVLRCAQVKVCAHMSSCGPRPGRGGARSATNGFHTHLSYYRESTLLCQ